MKTLLVYASKNGFTGKAAGLLAQKLAGDVQMVDLVREKAPDPAGYDTVVVGGSVYMGKVQPQVSAFLQQNTDVLLQKKLGLFLCCARLEQLEEQMKAAFPEPLYSHGVREHLGHAYDFQRMNFFERAIIRKLAKVSESEECLNTGNLEQLAGALG
jgi:menaquinone-dependent protoporphyrinogen oxidase